jgi:hypothetical protein
MSGTLRGWSSNDALRPGLLFRVFLSSRASRSAWFYTRAVIDKHGNADKNLVNTNEQTNLSQIIKKF